MVDGESRGLKIPKSNMPDLKGDLGKIYLGIRPEQMSWVSEGEREALIELTADVVEPTGPDTLVAGLVGHQNFMARIDPKITPKTGDQLRLQLDMDSAVFFRASDGMNLARM